LRRFGHRHPLSHHNRWRQPEEYIPPCWCLQRHPDEIQEAGEIKLLFAQDICSGRVTYTKILEQSSCKKVNITDVTFQNPGLV
jgi:hypothetical protein